MNWHDLNAILPLQSEEQVLRLLTEEARRLNVHLHVCEVQLVLRCFLALSQAI